MIKTLIEIGYNHPELDKLRAELEKIKVDRPYVKVGVLGTAVGGKDLREQQEKGGLQSALKAATAQAERHTSNISNVQLAVIHEFGAPSKNIPERSFIRAPFERNLPRYREMLAKLVKTQVYTEKRSYMEVLGLLGLRIAADLKKNFTEDNGWQANAASTVEAKGSSRALIDTGALRASISHEVVEKTGSEE